jgi:probable rRNA maturation factor
MVEIELVNRSGVPVDSDAVAALCRHVLAAEGVADGDLGVAFVPPEEIRRLKRDHLGIDEQTDVLSFPIDGRDELQPGVPRQLGDVVICPQVVTQRAGGAVTGEVMQRAGSVAPDLDGAWRSPLVHGLLHLLGYDHGDEMEQREAALAP